MGYIANHVWLSSGHAREAMVLAHLIKDTDLDLDQPRSNTSQWLHIASEEATDAIEHPEILEFGPSMDAGHFAGASNPWGAWQPSSRTSSSWDSHVPEIKGYGKGKSGGKDNGTFGIGII